MDLLYHDENTTCDNIAYSVRDLPECRTVITSIANLYLRRQIIFEKDKEYAENEGCSCPTQTEAVFNRFAWIRLPLDRLDSVYFLPRIKLCCC